MAEVALQDVAPERFGAYAPFCDEDKRRVEEAGQALILGQAGAVDSLIKAASPLCVIVTGQLVARYKRLREQRDDFREQATEALAKAVASLDRRFRDGSLKGLKSTFRAYLSTCIRHRLIRYSQQSDRETRALLDELSDDELSDEIDCDVSLSQVEKKVFVEKKRGKQWEEIASSINRCPRTAQRIYKLVCDKRDGKSPAKEDVMPSTQKKTRKKKEGIGDRIERELSDAVATRANEIQRERGELLAAAKAAEARRLANPQADRKFRLDTTPPQPMQGTNELPSGGVSHEDDEGEALV